MAKPRIMTSFATNDVLRATVIGFTAVLMWATLALLTTLSGRVPPFQLTAMAFSIAFVIGLVFWFKQGRQLSFYAQLPWRVWLLGVGGLFGYHFFLLRRPAKCAPGGSQLNRLSSGLLSDCAAVLLFARENGLRWFHGVRCFLAGFAGAALLITEGQGFSFNWDLPAGLPGGPGLCPDLVGLFVAVPADLGRFPTSAVGGFCGVTAVAGLGVSWSLGSNGMALGLAVVGNF